MRDVIADPKLRTVLRDNPKYLFGAMPDVPEVRVRVPFILAGLRDDRVASLAEAKRPSEQVEQTLLSYPQSSSSIPLVGQIRGLESNARPMLGDAIVQREERALFFASPLPSLLTRSGVHVTMPLAGCRREHRRSWCCKGTLDSRTDADGYGRPWPNWSAKRR